MAKPAATRKPSMPSGIICEPGRHVGCLHAKMAQKRNASRKP